jgi:lipopolysaccharide transport system permease protein
MTATTTIRIIKPHSERSTAEDVADIWTNRELLMVLVRREISVRYRQTFIGRR